MTLSAYSVYDHVAGQSEGAVLVFANRAADAKQMAFGTIRSWLDSEWIDVRAMWLSRDAAWLAEQEGVDLEGPPRMIESPKYCQRCEAWGSAPLDSEGICDSCREDEDDSQ